MRKIYTSKYDKTISQAIGKPISENEPLVIVKCRSGQMYGFWMSSRLHKANGRVGFKLPLSFLRPHSDGRAYWVQRHS